MRIKYPENWTQTDCDSLDAMFERARKENLWFFHGGLSGPLWFSPDELQAAQDGGKLVWGAVNWELRPPQEALDRFDEQIANLLKERKEFERRMTARHS